LAYLNASAIPWFSEISRAIFLLLLAVLSEITNRVTFYLEPPRRFTPYKIPTGIGPYYPEGPLYSPLAAFDCPPLCMRLDQTTKGEVLEKMRLKMGGHYIPHGIKCRRER
jgi:hypothetical protein